MGASARDIELERDLATRAKSSMAAFGELYDIYLTPIYNFVLRRVGNEKDAEDLTAQTFEKALLSIGRYEWQGISFSAWLYRIAANNVTDHYRKRKRVRLVGMEEADVSAGLDDIAYERIEEHDRHELLLRSMQKLPVQYNQVLCMKFFDELDNEEMAEVIGCSRSNLAVKVYRSLRALRKIVLAEGGLEAEAFQPETAAEA